ncbi:MAG: 30S ribosomal protein S5 [Patescibacteria group bacterium]|nr:30S ribosomal protein S5 [Patescibacteria group bacterium]
MPQEKPQQQQQQRNRRGPRRGESRERDEFDQVILDLARVTRVMAGGKRMRFRACVAIGDRNGKVGIGLAKGADVQLAISKATNDAKKNLVPIVVTDTGTIPHQVRIKNRSAHIFLKPAPSGTGVIAGSVVRQILELTGIRDVVAKIMGTGNKVNNAQTLMDALALLRPPKKRKASPVAAPAEAAVEAVEKEAPKAPEAAEAVKE